MEGYLIFVGVGIFVVGIIIGFAFGYLVADISKTGRVNKED